VIAPSAAEVDGQHGTSDSPEVPVHIQKMVARRETEAAATLPPDDVESQPSLQRKPFPVSGGTGADDVEAEESLLLAERLIEDYRLEAEAGGTSEVNLPALKSLETEVTILRGQVKLLTKKVTVRQTEAEKALIGKVNAERQKHAVAMAENLVALNEVLKELDTKVIALTVAYKDIDFDISLTNLAEMLLEACGICLTKASVLELLAQGGNQTIPIQLRHSELALEAATKAKDDLNVTWDYLQHIPTKKKGVKIRCNWKAWCLMAAADEYLEVAIWEALKVTWHTLAINLMRGPNATHFGIRCSHCNAIPIQGPRYRSISGDEELDLCQGCFLRQKYSPYILFMKIEVPIPIGHYEARCSHCKKVPIIGGRFRSRNNENENTPPYELCNKCYNQDPDHFLGGLHLFDEFGSEENKLRSFKLPEHSMDDTLKAKEWFHCSGCQQQRKYTLHGPVFWLLGVKHSPPVMLCSSCESYRSLSVIEEAVSRKQLESGIDPSKAMWLVAWRPVTEVYFFDSTTRSMSIPRFYTLEDEPLIAEMVYKPTNREMDQQMKLILNQHDYQTARNVLAKGSLNQKSLAGLCHQVGEVCFMQIYSRCFKLLNVQLEPQIQSFYMLRKIDNGTVEDVIEDAKNQVKLNTKMYSRKNDVRCNMHLQP